MCCRMPEGWKIVSQDGRVFAEPPEGVEVSVPPPYCTAVTLRPVLDGSATPDEMDAVSARQAVDLQLHKHTARCKKGGRLGNDEDCALDAVRSPHPATSYEDGVLLVRLDVASMVFHAPAVTKALRCNTAIYLFAEQSRFNFRRQTHLAAVRRGEASASDAPEMRTIAEASAEATEYSSKYAGKHDFAPRSANAIASAVEKAAVSTP